ncbi:hypothetical protein ACWF95_37790 [Streptomyces vinaceus]
MTRDSERGAAVGFVDNPGGHDSRLRTLTITQYRQERLAHTLSALQGAGTGREH